MNKISQIDGIEVLIGLKKKAFGFLEVNSNKTLILEIWSFFWIFSFYSCFRLHVISSCSSSSCSVIIPKPKSLLPIVSCNYLLWHCGLVPIVVWLYCFMPVLLPIKMVIITTTKPEKHSRTEDKGIHQY